MKKRFFISITSLLLTVAFCLLLSSCSDSKYTLIFHTNSEDSISNISKTKAELETYILTEPKKEGYTFVGWYFDNAYEKPYSYESLSKDNTLVELYAKYNINEYTITVHSTKNIEYKFKYGEAIKIEPLEKTDHNFVGYYTDEALTKEFNLKTMPANNIDLYPKFDEVYYTLVFYTNSEDNISNISKTKAELESYKLSEPEKEGYTFEGWYFDNAYEHPYSYESLLKDKTLIELYAKYTINEYKITVHSTENIEYKFKYGETIEIEPVEKVEHNFVGYFTDEELKKEFNLTTMPANNIDLYPKFDEVYYTLVFHTNSEDNISNISKTKEELESYILSEPEKEGYTFDGWYFDNAYEHPYSYESLSKDKTLIELYAKYTINEYKVTVHSTENVEYKFKYGETIELVPIETNEHNFVGYYIDEGLTKEFNLTTMPASNIDLYPKHCQHKWHVMDTVLNMMYCEECGFESFPLIKIKVDNEITSEYSNSLVSVNSGNQYYDFDDKSCSIKIRGNGTARLNKKPYRLKFDKKQKMLGLNDDLEAKSWVLLAEWNGYSVSNMTAFNISKEIYKDYDYYSSDYCFVCLYLNDNYEGIYLLAEQQQINSERINVYEPSTSTSDLNIGYLLEMDWYGKIEPYHFSAIYPEEIITHDGKVLNRDNFVKTYTIKNDIYCDDQFEFIKKVLINAIDILYDSLCNDHNNLEINPYKTFDNNFDIVADLSIKNAKDAVKKIIDYDSLITMFLIQEICADPDVAWSSFYISFDASKSNPKLVFEAPWDFDIAFTNTALDEFFYLLSSNYNWHQYYNYWFMIFANSEWFIRDVCEKYQELMCDKIIDNAILKVEAFVHNNFELLFDNYKRWPGIFECSELDLMNFKNKYFLGVYRLIDHLKYKKALFNTIINALEPEPPVITGYNISFIVPDDASILIYPGKDYTVEGTLTKTLLLEDVSGDGQLNFKVIVPDGYTIESVNVVGEYKNLKLPSEVGNDNTYRITKITSDLNITVTLVAIS